MKKHGSLILSIVLHLALIITLLLSGSGDGNGNGGKGKGKGDSEKENGKDRAGVDGENRKIIPKEVEEPKVVDVQLVPGDSEMFKKLEREQKKLKAIKDCEGTPWFGGIGIGVGVSLRNEGLITEVYPGYPAAKAGLKPMDEILGVISGGPDIRGEPGTAVTIRIYRPSMAATFDVVLVRAKVCVKE